MVFRFISNDCKYVIAGDNLIIDQCEIINNTITSNDTGMVSFTTQFTAYDSNFVGNVLTGIANGCGRMFRLNMGKRATFVGCNFYDNVSASTNNSTKSFFYVDGGELILDNCRLSNNTVRDFDDYSVFRQRQTGCKAREAD